MKTLLMFATFLFSLLTWATPPPANYPIVKGEVRKVDLHANRITIKHEEIPNLHMAPMTMSFLAQDPQLLNGLVVGDQINFVADEIDGDLTVLWLEKQTEPALPIVKGIVRKVDLATNRITIKHEAIPNLNMGPMTMSFLAQDPHMLVGLAAGDRVNFTADEIDDELTVIWIEKAATQGQMASEILCTGQAPTNPRTNVEINVRPETFSTIRYEYAEGPYQGTSYINSIGHMVPQVFGDQYFYRSGEGNMATVLQFGLRGTQFLNPRFTNFSSGMNQTPVQCNFQE